MQPSSPLDTINFRRVFPWLHLFRAFWIAVDLRKLLLAGCALLLIRSGTWVWDQLLLVGVKTEQEMQERDRTRWPWQQSLDYDLQHANDPLGELHGGLRDPWNTLQRIGRNWKIALRPMAEVADPVVSLMDTRVTWMERANGTVRLLWGLVIWAIFGGAIGRMTAVQFARDQRISLWSGLRFACGNFFNYVYAPLLPLLGMAALWLVCLVIGVIGRVPGSGPTVAAAVWGIGLACGFLMTLILMGVTAGWPIMFATINVEGTDGFDGLSRGFHYLLERPLHYFGYAVFCIAFGAFAIFFVWMVAHLIVYLTALAIASGMGPGAIRNLMDGPAMAVPPTLLPAAPGESNLASQIVGVWHRGVAVLVVGFVYSFFWTSTTIIYLLLRRSADGKELDEVYYVPEVRRDALAAYAPPDTAPPAAETLLAAPQRIDLAP